MEIKRSIEIVVEKTRRFVIRQPETDQTISCPVCGEPMLAAEASAVLFRAKCRLIYQLVEAGAAHFVETEAGALFVCPSSLDRAIGDADDASPAVTRVEIEQAGVAEQARTDPDQPMSISQFQNS